MSLRPIETARMLYKFVDLPWTEETEEYIRNTTIGKMCVSVKNWFGLDINDSRSLTSMLFLH